MVRILKIIRWVLKKSLAIVDVLLKTAERLKDPPKKTWVDSVKECFFRPPTRELSDIEETLNINIDSDIIKHRYSVLRELPDLVLQAAKS